MGTEYLMDSNAVIDYLNNMLPPSGMAFVSKIVDATPSISVISQIEILRFNTPLHAHKVLAAFIDYCKVYPLDKEVVQITIDICKQSRIKLPDAIIAATSIFHHFTLITRNIDDFKDIAGLKYVNPWKI